MRPLDDFLHEFEFSERHRLSIAAPPERSDEALRSVSLAEILAYDRPDACKADIDFRVAPALTTETRVHVPDPTARRRFRRYWLVVRPFSGLIRILFLRAARRRAEAGA